MQHLESAELPIHSLSAKVRNIDKASRELSTVMSEQLDAVVASDATMVLQLTEKNASAQQYFHKAEQELIAELHTLTTGADDNEERITLESLKTRFPEYTAYITEWQNLITGNVKRLQQQQDHLVQLLEFAQEQNGLLMRSVYNLQNGKNMHYRPNGETSSVQSGIAVNQHG